MAAKSSPLSMGTLFRRFHVIIFFLGISVLLAAAILNINSMLSDTAVDESYTSSINPGSIDSATLTKINELHASDEVTSLPAASGASRSNPFSE